MMQEFVLLIIIIIIIKNNIIIINIIIIIIVVVFGYHGMCSGGDSDLWTPSQERMTLHARPSLFRLPY